MEENHDLSLLPTEILHQIISKLSFKEAVQTSALSTSWRSLMGPTCLNLLPGSDLSRLIESSSSSSPAAGFQTLKLHLPSCSAAAFAVCTKGVHGELHLNFPEHRHQFSELVIPTTTLFLRQDPLIPRPRLSCMAMIKTLHLRSVGHLAGEMVSDLCSSCSFLESLTLEKCHGLQRIEVEANQSLKNLEIAECSNVVGVSVSAQNLHSFSYKGALALLQFLHVPNLAAVTLDFRDGGVGNYIFDIEDSLCLLSSIKDIESLHISSWLIEALCCGGVEYSKLDFQLSRLKYLKLMICSKISSKTRDSLACFLHVTPSLEELELRVENDGSRCVEIPYSYQHWHEPHLWRDFATVKKEASRLEHLKTIKIKGFGFERDELLWMDLLLHNAINLKEMIIDDSWRVVRVPYSQLGYIKRTYFLVPCPDLDSHFVFIEDSNSKL